MELSNMVSLGFFLVGKDYAENFNLEKSYFRADLMVQDDDGNEM